MASLILETGAHFGEAGMFFFVYLRILQIEGLQSISQGFANTNAMFAIGNLYANGFGVGKDLEEAAKWYCKAAMLGHPQATEMLGDEEQVEAKCGAREWKPKRHKSPN